ncbi:MAG TPA: hypothetical protein PKM72_12255 [Nitrospirales bacterium]|nr:hypothetical protein [Nitrospirales bacterium]
MCWMRWVGMSWIVGGELAIPMNMQPAWAGKAAEIDRDVGAALEKFYAHRPVAKDISTIAQRIPILPDVYKAEFMHAGQFGDEALCKQGKIVGYYRTVAASYGLQAGIHSIHPSIPSIHPFLLLCVILHPGESP